jgi:ABC-2 type transport system permease protein
VNKALLLARREMFSYFRSPLGAIIIAGSLLFDGIYFYWKGLTERLVSADVLIEFFYGASAPTMIGGLLLSMRLLAEERQQGTITLLNTSPITDGAIVLGKYMSALAVITVMTALTVYMPLLILVNGKISVGHVLVGYGGLFLLGSATIALGMFASALARSQVVAIIIGAVILGVLILLWVVARAVDPPLNSFLNALAFHHENYRPFMIGTLRLQSVVYYVAVTFFFLLAATKTLEARRWR